MKHSKPYWERLFVLEWLYIERGARGGGGEESYVNSSQSNMKKYQTVISLKRKRNIKFNKMLKAFLREIVCLRMNI